MMQLGNLAAVAVRYKDCMLQILIMKLLCI